MSLSRRNFLKRAGGVAAAVAVAPTTLAATAPRETLVEQRIPDYEPPVVPDVTRADPLNLPPFPDYDQLSFLLSRGFISQRSAMEALGFNPDHNSLMTNYVRGALLKGFPE